MIDLTRTPATITKGPDAAGKWRLEHPALSGPVYFDPARPDVLSGADIARLRGGFDVAFKAARLRSGLSVDAFYVADLEDQGLFMSDLVDGFVAAGVREEHAEHIAEAWGHRAHGDDPWFKVEAITGA